MFEAVVALCLDLAAGPCRDQLLPGYEAATIAECQAALDERPPALDLLSTQGVLTEPVCRAVGEALTVEEIAPGVFVHLGQIAEPDTRNDGDVSNFGFVIGGESVAVIDTGSARWIGERLWRAIRTRTSKPVSHVVLTHPHPDHVFGVAPFVAAGATVVAHEKLPRALADRQSHYLQNFADLIGTAVFLGTQVLPVSIKVGEETAIDLGDRVLILRPWSAAHSTADLTVLDRASGTLFAGDLVFDRHTPTLDGRLKGWQVVLAEMAAIDAVRIVPGHGGPVLAWPRGLDPVARYLKTLEVDTRRAIADGVRLGVAVDTIAQSEAPKWELFETYNPRNATVAFTELEWE